MMQTKTAPKTKTLVIVALFVAMSFAGSQIRIFGTIAFDALPGFIAALLLGPTAGAAIGLLGHLFTSATAGFPLSLPLHLVVAVAMAITMYGFGGTYKLLQGKCSKAITFTTTGIVGVILNGPFALGCSILALGLMAGWEAGLGLLALLLPLTVAAVVNVALSLVVFKAVERVWNERI